MSRYDAIVVGAGPSGLTCARDLRSQGHSVLVIEARDRVGGRTWTSSLDGYDERIELGGTYIHPNVQHNLSREIQRYDQPLAVGSGRSLRAGFHVDGSLRQMPIPPDQVVALERALLAMATACKRIDANASLAGQYISDLDVSMDAFFAPHRLPRATREIIDGIIAGVTQCDVREVSMLQWLGWMAGEGSPIGLFFSVTDEKLKDGMSALWNAMADDARADFAFGGDVVSVAQEGQSVLVRTSAGDQHEARVCVVAVGSQVIDRIEFRPALDPARTALLHGQFVAPGFKSFLVVDNAPPGFTGFSGFGGARDPRLAWLFEDRQLADGKILMVAWGIGEFPSLDEAQRAIAEYLPGAVVSAIAGHDWAKDQYARGINHFHRPGEALRFASVVGQPHGRVLFAGGDVTPGIWNGWIEGAVDAGRLASQRAAAMLRSDNK